MRAKIFQISLCLSLLFTLTNCKVKNPVSSKKSDEDKKLESDEVTANVIFSFKFAQHPLFDTEMRDALSGFLGRAFVATESSSLAASAAPTAGCMPYSQSFPAITLTRYLNFGLLSLIPLGQAALSYSPAQSESGEFYVSDSLYLGPGTHELETQGLNGVFRTRQRFVVPTVGANLQAQSVGGIYQSIPSPAYDPSSLITIQKSSGLTLHYTNVSGASFVRVIVADYENEPVICFAPVTGSINVPASFLNGLANTDNAVMYIDFVKTQLGRSEDGLVKQLYIESYMRHVHGLYLADQSQIPFGILRLQ
jgi:hypothetical protein